MIVKCCMCGSIIGGLDGTRAEKDVTHTYCDECLKELIEIKHDEEGADMAAPENDRF